jgi:hypothetical protein
MVELSGDDSQLKLKKTRQLVKNNIPLIASHSISNNITEEKEKYWMMAGGKAQIVNFTSC